MDPEIVETLARLRELEGNGPFGDARVRSNLINSGVSHGLQAAAGNLLGKALRAVVAGEDARAAGYVQRAVELPVDEHEEVHPGWWEASMLLFTAVTDAMEACEEDHPAWLDAAEQVLRTATGTARLALLHTLGVITRDYLLSHRELRRVREMIGDDEPAADWPRDEPSGPTAPEILTVVRAVAAYHDALARVP